MYETMDQPSVSEIVDLLIDVNRLLPATSDGWDQER